MIYTALTSDIDTLGLPKHDDRYVAFHDGDAMGWECVKPFNQFKDPRRNARFHKVLMPASDYDHVLWVDANILPTKKLSEYVEMLEDYDMLTFKHTSRNCVYKEAACVLGWQMEDIELIKGQVIRYLADKYPHDNGLAETGFLLRRNNDKVAEFNRLWWEEICRGSKRDQLSFNYCVWKTGIKVKYIEPSITNSPLVEYRQHEVVFEPPSR